MHLDSHQAQNIAPAIIQWQRTHGRHHLAWQNTLDPYRVWLSEIMLQQTQVATVIPYYDRFLQAFPDVTALAQASQDEVLAHWAGLGYYSRARNLHNCARVIVSEWGGQFPQTQQQLQTLPGIGRSTAAAIAAFCFGQRTSILDGNVRRVFCRYFGVEGDPTSSAVQKTLWTLADQAVPSLAQTQQAPDSMQRYTQGLMDLGAMVCTRSAPHCAACPLKADCVAHQTNRTASLPTPRVRKPRPERVIHMLLVRQQQQIWLNKRPDTGIWAGLWSLPEAVSEQQLRSWLQDRLLNTPLQLHAMARISHDLTHFRMLIQPWHLELPSELPAQELWPSTAQSAWVSASSLSRYGVPAPILPLVQAFTQPCETFLGESQADDC